MSHKIPELLFGLLKTENFYVLIIGSCSCIEKRYCIYLNIQSYPKTGIFFPTCRIITAAFIQGNG
jgi:hypothetical protein